MRRRAREAGRAIALPATPCPRAGGSRGSRAGRRPVQQGRAAPLTRGHAGPYQRPPPTRPATLHADERFGSLQARVATTARIRRSVCGTAICRDVSAGGWRRYGWSAWRMPATGRLLSAAAARVVSASVSSIVDGTAAVSHHHGGDTLPPPWLRAANSAAPPGIPRIAPR